MSVLLLTVFSPALAHMTDGNSLFYALRDYDEETYEHLSSRRRQELDSLRSIAILRCLTRFTMVGGIVWYSLLLVLVLVSHPVCIQ